MRHEYVQQGFRNQIPYLFGYMFTFRLPLPWQSRLFLLPFLCIHITPSLAKRGRWQALFPHPYPLRLLITFPFLHYPVCPFAQVPRYCTYQVFIWAERALGSPAHSQYGSVQQRFHIIRKKRIEKDDEGREGGKTCDRQSRYPQPCLRHRQVRVRDEGTDKDDESKGNQPCPKRQPHLLPLPSICSRQSVRYKRNSSSVILRRMKRMRL